MIESNEKIETKMLQFNSDRNIVTTTTIHYR